MKEVGGPENLPNIGETTRSSYRVRKSLEDTMVHEKENFSYDMGAFIT